MAKAKKNQDTEQLDQSIDVLAGHLDETREEHLNFYKQVDYIVSTGSLMLDLITGGGIRPSILRSSGVSEGGKTSFNLTLMLNFLKQPKRKGVLIKAEGRLSEAMQQKYGFFVNSADEWAEGTCFVFETNIFETAFSLIKKLITHNDQQIQYHFIVDSLDALVPREVAKKEIGEAWKVGGAALLSSQFLATMANRIARLGHIVSLISQVRSAISINPYQKGDPKLTNASGGNSWLHYSDWILEFQPRHQADLIKVKDEVVGHNCKVIFKKSANEVSGRKISYPVRYKINKGSSVWVEREIVAALLSLGLAKKKTAWVELDSGLVKDLGCPAQFNGMDAFSEYLQQNLPVAEKLYRKLSVSDVGFSEKEDDSV